jgi:hypothetical protein
MDSQLTRFSASGNNFAVRVGMTLIEYVCQDVLNVIRFGVLIGYKVRRRSVLVLYNILDSKVQ